MRTSRKGRCSPITLPSVPVGGLAVRTSVWIAVACPSSGRVLLAKRSQTTRNSGQWNFFGGGLDRGERPKKTARRELREEAGIQVGDSRLVPLGEAVSAGKRNLLYGLAVDSEIQPKLNQESEAFRWMPPGEITAHHLLHHATRQLWPVCQAWLNTLGDDPPAADLSIRSTWQRLRRIFETAAGEPG